MNTTFTSIFAQDMKNFLELQKSLNFNPESYRPRLKQFDNFLSQRSFQLQSLSKKVIFEWIERKEGETNNGRRARLFALNKFLKYLCELGRCECIIPKGCFDKAIPFSPYLFSDYEISRFFSACDSFPVSIEDTESTIVMPVVFRMIYCCALRPGEAFRLKRDEVDLTEGILQIKQSKHHKDRIVWMSRDLLELCRSYEKLSNNNRIWFFSSSNGGPLPQSWLTNRFKKCISLAEIGNGISNPRIYDFRHSACSRVVLQWIEEGGDVNNLVCYLREHMGHSSFSHTLYYLHILPDNLLSSVGIDWESIDDLYPSLTEEVKR